MSNEFANLFDALLNGTSVYCGKLKFVNAMDQLDKAANESKTDNYINDKEKEITMNNVKTENKDSKPMGKTSPWVGWVNKLTQFFIDDQKIEIVYNGLYTPEVVDIYIQGEDKFEAAIRLIGEQRTFGSFVLNIRYHLGNAVDVKEKSTEAYIRDLFDGNNAVHDIVVIRPEFTNNPFTYVEFENKTVQYWDDNLGNPHGYETTLNELLANDIFKDDLGGIFFTTHVDK